MSFTAEGFHGTSRENAERIQKEGEFKVSDKGWLGTGIYFFCNGGSRGGFDNARRWVEQVKKLCKWVVFRATIRCENIIDLVDDVGHKKLFEDCWAEVTRSFSATRWKDFHDEQRTQFVLIALSKRTESGKEIEVIRAKVNPRRYAYIILESQVQICVLDLNCIRDFSIVESRGQ